MQVQHRLLGRAPHIGGFLLAVGGEDVEARHHVRRGALFRGAELLAIDLDRLHQRRGRKVRGEGVGEPERGRELRAEEAGAKNPDRHVEAGARHRAHAPARRCRLEIALQLHHVAGKVVDVAGERAPERVRSHLVRSRRTPDAEVDPPWIERFEGAELLGDDQRRMVRQHDTAGTDADGRGCARDVTDQHRRRGAADTRHVVMLGQPIAAETQALDMAGELHRVAEGLRRIRAFGDRREVEDRECDHGPGVESRVSRMRCGGGRLCPCLWPCCAFGPRCRARPCCSAPGFRCLPRRLRAWHPSARGPCR